jgi:hypothetical protein
MRRAVPGLSLQRLAAAIGAGARHPLLLVRPADYVAASGKLVRDLLALANTALPGDRFLVLGVVRGPLGLNAIGLTAAQHAAALAAMKAAVQCIEPSLRIDYMQWPVRDASVGVLALSGDDRPYLARCKVDKVLQAGDGWIRGRHGVRRLTRRDMDRCYRAKMGLTDFAGDVSVQFAGDRPEMLRLQPVALPELPSRLAAERLRALLDAKRLLACAGTQRTYMGRLAFARLSDGEPYVERGEATLQLELARVTDAFAEQDRSYKFTQQAHAFNLRLSITGGNLDAASLVLQVPAGVGVELAGGVDAELAEHSGAIRISRRYTRLPAGAHDAFTEPLRVYLSEIAAGYKFPLRYELRARNLPRAITGKLYLVCKR